MKLKIDIDLEELIHEIFEDYTEDEGVDLDLKYEIKQSIIHESKMAVLKELKEPAKKDIQTRIGLLVKDAYAEEIATTVKEFVKNNKIKGRYTTDPELTVKEWIESRFSESINDSKLSEIVKAQAVTISEELRSRYDMFFATQLVIKINDQGLLKEGVMDTLLTPKKD